MSGSSKAKLFAYTSLGTWILLVFFLYLNENWANVNYCLRIYATLPSYGQTLLLFLIPCLALAFVVVTLRLAKFFLSRRA